MRVAMLGLFASLALLASPAVAQTADPLAPARAGQLQCFEPNVVAKTCQSISGYTFQANGVIDNPAHVLINPAPAIVMHITSPVTVRNGAVCGPFEVADIQRATFTVDGAAANAEDTAAMRTGLAEQLAPALGRETCITLTPDGDGFRADTTIGGIPQPQQTQHVIWVGANDGYRVAP